MAHLPAFYVISLVSEKALILYHNKPEKASRFCHFLRDSEPFDKLKHSMIQPLSRMNDPVVLAVALIAGTVPFFARQIESVLAEVDYGLVEASASMGFSPLEIIFSVYLKESIPGITRVTMITFVSLIGITAMAGAIGAGGLGDFAIRYGYQMGYRDMIWVTVIIILIIISVIQGIGNFIIKKTTH